MVSKYSRLSALALTLALVSVLAACAPTQPTQAPAAPAATAAPVATNAPAPTQPPAATNAPVATQAPAPTQAAAPTTAPAAGPVAISYAKDVQPIFDQNCVKCHGGSDGTKGGLSLKSYADLMNGGQDGQVIAPGDAANSMLVQSIMSGKMPKRQAKLSQDKIDMIAAWVAAGAQNN